MLGAPGGELAVLFDLGAQDAIDAPRHGGGRPGAADRVDEVIRRLSSGGSAQNGQDIDHRVVVIGDVRVVAFAQREILRPAAVGILGGEQVVDAAIKAARYRASPVACTIRARKRIGVVVAPLSIVSAPRRPGVSASASDEGGDAAKSVFLGQPPWGDCHRVTLSAIARAPAVAYHSGFCLRMDLPQGTCVWAPDNSVAISNTPSVAPILLSRDSFTHIYRAAVGEHLMGVMSPLVPKVSSPFEWGFTLRGPIQGNSELRRKQIASRPRIRDVRTDGHVAPA